MIEGLERSIVGVAPAVRRRFAIHILLWSLVAGMVNDCLWLAHVIDDRMLIFITLNLSWLAITLTAGDVVMTTDVRVNE